MPIYDRNASNTDSFINLIYDTDTSGTHRQIAQIYDDDLSARHIIYPDSAVWGTNLYNAGDQCTQWTNGWYKPNSYMSHANYWYGSGLAAGTTGSASFESSYMQLHTTTGAAVYQGVGVATNKAVKVSNVSVVKAQIWAYESNNWNYTYLTLGRTSEIRNVYEPVSNYGACTVLQIRGADAYTLSLSLSGVNSAYIMVGIAVSDWQGLGARVERVWVE